MKRGFEASPSRMFRRVLCRREGAHIAAVEPVHTVVEAIPLGSKWSTCEAKPVRVESCMPMVIALFSAAREMSRQGLASMSAREEAGE